MLLICTYIEDGELVFVLQKYIKEHDLIALDTLCNIFKEIDFKEILKIPKTFFIFLDLILDDQIAKKINFMEYSSLIQNCFWNLFLVFCNHLSETFALLSNFDHVDTSLLKFLLGKLGEIISKYSNELPDFLKTIESEEILPIFKKNPSRFDYISKVFLWYECFYSILGSIK